MGTREPYRFDIPTRHTDPFHVPGNKPYTGAYHHHPHQHHSQPLCPCNQCHTSCTSNGPWSWEQETHQQQHQHLDRTPVTGEGHRAPPAQPTTSLSHVDLPKQGSPTASHFAARSPQRTAIPSSPQETIQRFLSHTPPATTAPVSPGVATSQSAERTLPAQCTQSSTVSDGLDDSTDYIPSMEASVHAVWLQTVVSAATRLSQATSALRVRGHGDNPAAALVQQATGLQEQVRHVLHMEGGHGDDSMQGGDYDISSVQGSLIQELSTLADQMEHQCQLPTGGDSIGRQ